MERVVRERMTTQDVEAITPQTLINIRPVVAAIKEFFGTSQLSQFMDQVNPLSGLTHRRRLLGARPGWPVTRAGRLRGPRRPLQPLRPDVPDRDAGGPEHRPHRRSVDLRPGERVRLHRVAVPQGRRRPASPARSSTWRPTRRRTTSSPRPTRRSTPTARSGTSRVLVRRSPQAASLDDLRKMLEQESFFGATTDIGYVPPTEVDYMDVRPSRSSRSPRR